MSFLYSFVCYLADFNHREPYDLKFSEAVYFSQYWVKGLATLFILTIFCSKSAVMLDIMEHTETYKREMKHPRPFEQTYYAGAVFMTFLLFNAIMIGSRIYQTFVSHRDCWGLINSFPWFDVNYMQDEMFTGFVSNFTESLRLLCSGFVGLILVEFSCGPASECRAILQRTKSLADLSSDLPKAWTAREQSLVTAIGFRTHLTTLLIMILLSDVICLNAAFSSFVVLTVPESLVRLVVSILLYVVSIYSVVQGLICLTHTDDSTLEIVQQLQSVSGQARAQPRQTLPALVTRANVDPDVVELRSNLMTFSAGCFGGRKLAPPLHGLGNVTQGTVFTIFGLLFTFLIFMMEESHRSDAPPSPAAECSAGVFAAFNNKTKG
ncbi:hypothetical protein BV898_06297 [Hypsibius exemplaris]|uniref:Gustatory receptor n=1 Tax=Hypsibius exemplaris TaxID=2072580 RepID=A0A1W0WX35_HYPEX|nr:hypothetical protein BV898_06297 [Hypsibius exemplaris]